MPVVRTLRGLPDPSVSALNQTERCARAHRSVTASPSGAAPEGCVFERGAGSPSRGAVECSNEDLGRGGTQAAVTCLKRIGNGPGRRCWHGRRSRSLRRVSHSRCDPSDLGRNDPARSRCVERAFEQCAWRRHARTQGARVSYSDRADAVCRSGISPGELRARKHRIPCRSRPYEAAHIAGVSRRLEAHPDDRKRHHERRPGDREARARLEGGAPDVPGAGGSVAQRALLRPARCARRARRLRAVHRRAEALRRSRESPSSCRR